MMFYIIFRTYMSVNVVILNIDNYRIISMCKTLINIVLLVDYVDRETEHMHKQSILSTMDAILNI